MELTTRDYTQAIDLLRSGAIYDALIAVGASKVQADRLGTLNVRDFERLSDVPGWILDMGQEPDA
ncbi:MAG: hypothetical protein AB1758_24670 [Candidatus Eremiobacterota bacterium]